MIVYVIGAGPAGLMAAGTALSYGAEVTVIDGNEKAGKKLYLTGKGRCNVTNNVDAENFLNNVVNGRKFLYSAINNFPPQSTMKLFNDLGVELKVERGNRVFPASNKASDITSALVKYCNGCKFLFNEKVVAVDVDDKKRFILKTTKSTYLADKIIVATGGVSYTATGSTGDGYKIARHFGHEVLAPRPALSPIRIADSFIPNWEGISLKNVELIAHNEKYTNKLFGEMLFTQDGISGPIALSMASFINRQNGIQIKIDFKPALNEEQVENRLLREFSNSINRDIRFVIEELLPKRMVKDFLKVVGIDENRKVNSITKEERHKINRYLKNFPLTYGGLYPTETAIVTSGGVKREEINPRTMESKLCEGLYFAGEVMDCDALTGGYNIQIALSTGYCAGKSAGLKSIEV